MLGWTAIITGVACALITAAILEGSAVRDNSKFVLPQQVETLTENQHRLIKTVDQIKKDSHETRVIVAEIEGRI